MSDSAKKAPAWTVELLPRGGDPEAPSQVLMDVQMTPDYSRVRVKRAGPDGKLHEMELAVDGPADLFRLFAAEVIGLIASQANKNYQQAGLGTAMTAPISFGASGEVISEIFQRGQLYRKVVFDPKTTQLTVSGTGGVALFNGPTEELALNLAKTLGVTLPLSKP